MTHFIIDGPVNAAATFLLSHGSGSGMDTEFMQVLAGGLAGHGIRVARFEFAYMAQRRSGGSNRPPPRAPVLEAEFRQVIDELSAESKLFIGGKSMGGRVATMIADSLFEKNKLSGVVCLGYPFHPVGKPEKLRTAHLEGLKPPTLICHGTRDPFGTPEEIKEYKLSKAIRINWIDDGDHSFKPRVKSGFTLPQNMQNAENAIAAFIAENS